MISEKDLLLIKEFSNGLSIIRGPPNIEVISSFDDKVRCLDVSKDGLYLAFATNLKLNILCLENEIKTKFCIESAGIQFLKISPKSSVVIFWATSKSTDQNNFFIYSLDTGTCIKKTDCKQSQWCPQWSFDESICARMVNAELHFFEQNNYDQYVNKFYTLKVESFSLATHRRTGTHYFAVYTVGAKGAPSSVSLFEYPDFKQMKAGKSLYRIDSVTFKWRERGDALLIICDCDHSKRSYYGEQSLHYLDIEGKVFTPRLNKRGPISSVEWDPSSNELYFCVIYGFVPSKVTLFNCKPEIVHDFGEQPVFSISYNPFGNLMTLHGHGGIHLVFDMPNRKLISEIQCPDTTCVSWAPDGVHLITGVTAPRMRVDNVFKVWHYSGKLIYEEACPSGTLLYRIIWKPDPLKFTQPTIIVTQNIKTSVTKPTPEKYVPPAMRKPGYKPPPPANCAGMTDKMKKIRSLQKKLKEIEKLKALQEEGKELEIKQVEKINREIELSAQLEKLQLEK